jgi:hypothetical protein
MKFKLRTVNANDLAIEGTYTISEAGVLSVKPDTGNLVVMSPAAWVSVEVTEAPERGAASV